MTERHCYIVGAGEFEKERFKPRPEDYIIAADGGYAYLQEMNIVPDLVVGDFDSLGFAPVHDNVVELPVMKDDTDLAFAAKTAMKEGYRQLHIFGATGGRLDHTIAAMQLLVKISETDACAYLYGCGYTMTALYGGSSCTDGKEYAAELVFDKNHTGGISVFSFTTQSKGVSEEGLLYTLSDAVLTSDEALGVSNSFTGEETKIRVKEGALIVMWYGNEREALPEHRRIEREREN